MCMVDDSDPPEVYSSATRKARKPHKCSECDRTIAIGETYLYQFQVYEGNSYSYRTCAHCNVAANWLVENCGGYLMRGVGEDIEQHADEYRPLALPLLKIVVGMRRDWRRFDGAGLMPLPKMPPSIKSYVHV